MAYSDLSIRAIGRGYEVQFRVENTGARSGTAVPQVYVGRPADPPVEMAPKQLAGFERVRLDAQEQKTVTIPIENRAFSYWSVEHDEWRIAPGLRPMYIGASSRDIRLEEEVRVE
mgnify:FL=1